MKYLILFLIMFIFGCTTSEFEVGECKEYRTVATCSGCENMFSMMSCTYETFVICRQSENEFISFNKPDEPVITEDVGSFVTDSTYQTPENINASE